MERKKRKFEGQLDENLEEMLPIKLQVYCFQNINNNIKDGRLLRPTREKDEEEVEEDDKDEKQKEEWKPEDFSGLSASELLAKRKQLLAETKGHISTIASHLLANPQENVSVLK